MKPELRVLPIEDAELRVEGEGDAPKKIRGFGVVYNKRSQDLGGFVEIIRPGAFKTSLESGKELKSFFNHDPNFVLATTRSEPPLIIRDRPGGIEYEYEIPDTSYGKDLEKNIAARRVVGSSFAFRTIKDNWYEDGSTQVREVLEAELFELGPVTNPAYLPSSVSVRSTKEVYDNFVAETRAREAAEAEKEKARARESELRSVEMQIINLEADAR